MLEVSSLSSSLLRTWILKTEWFRSRVVISRGREIRRVNTSSVTIPIPTMIHEYNTIWEVGSLLSTFCSDTLYECGHLLVGESGEISTFPTTPALPLSPNFSWSLIWFPRKRLRISSFHISSSPSLLQWCRLTIPRLQSVKEVIKCWHLAGKSCLFLIQSDIDRSDLRTLIISSIDLPYRNDGDYTEKV